ncbi:MAG TPA: peptide chain release factor N(5)-glutamine methyltransferase [Thermoanaerobaculia bacterium]|nr:peptide chain release factor N(5)-glutamine methyltransferase [Thermoanaerobaculia bacterium]
MTKERLDDIRARYREDALQRGINPRDVDLLLSDLLGRTPAWLFAHGDERIDPAPLVALLDRRYAGEPLQYIRGKTEFFSRTFFVDDRVLIPRPETEILVEAVIERAPENGRVIDIGTGSGCIAVTIERERPDLFVVSVDRSVDALAAAAVNRTRLASRTRLAASDLLSAVRGPFDVIVSNPPYVPLREYEQLAVEVRIHEPRMALTPGPRGTEIFERILDEAETRLAPRGRVMLEAGYGQEEAMRALSRERGWRVDAFLPDLAGIPRVVVLSRHAEQREMPLLPHRRG